MSKKKQCAYCSEEFTVGGNNHRYCSIICSRRYHVSKSREERHLKRKREVCIQCGKEFVQVRTDQKYCHYRCKHRTHRMKKGKFYSKKTAEWRSKNPEHYRALENKRRALEKGAGGKVMGKDIADMFVDQRGVCAYCESEISEGYHVDHMIPLSRGGSNDWSNIALTCADCNQRKHTKTAEEFVEGLS